MNIDQLIDQACEKLAEQNKRLPAAVVTVYKNHATECIRKVAHLLDETTTVSNIYEIKLITVELAVKNDFAVKLAVAADAPYLAFFTSKYSKDWLKAMTKIAQNTDERQRYVRGLLLMDMHIHQHLIEKILRGEAKIADVILSDPMLMCIE